MDNIEATRQQKASLSAFRYTHTVQSVGVQPALLKESQVSERESSLQVTKTTYSGLQEHRIVEYTATGQKARCQASIRHVI
jgi:hypothetical protein